MFNKQFIFAILFCIVLDNLSCFSLLLVWTVLSMTTDSQGISYP